MNDIDHVLKHYGGGWQEATAYRPDDRLGVLSMLRRAPDRVLEAMANPVCAGAGCGQRIAAHVRRVVIDARTFHPSCGERYRASQSRSQSTAAPVVIGAICGVALLFGEYCTIFNDPRGERFERFEYGAFDASIARGGQTLQVGHSNVPIPGRLELVTGPDLRFRCHVHDSTFGRSVIDKARRGVYRGASIRFQPIDERPGPYRSVVVHEGALVEVSLCETSRPAWCGTAVWLEE